MSNREVLSKTGPTNIFILSIRKETVEETGANEEKGPGEFTLAGHTEGKNSDNKGVVRGQILIKATKYRKLLKANIVYVLKGHGTLLPKVASR